MRRLVDVDKLAGQDNLIRPVVTDNRFRIVRSVFNGVMILKKLCIAIAIFGLYVSTATAQHQISGTVKDSADGSPVLYATAALMYPDSSVLTGVTTNEDGQFVLENVKTGDYLLQVSFIGYQKEYLIVKVPGRTDLGEITLSESVNTMKEVVVEGRRSLVEPKLDRIVINVAGNMITSGLNINDLLKQLPGLVVDHNGNVKLNGRNATVYIDGRPTRLPADQVAQMLNGMMGDVVDRVELIDNPSSRYEAGMSSAIINIRLKRDVSLGVNGTVQAGIGFTDYDFTWRGGANLNYRSKKINIFGNYGYNKKPDYQETWQTSHYEGSTPVTYHHYSLNRPTTSGHTLRAGIDWLVAPRHTIGFLFNGTRNDNDGDIVGDADITRIGSSIIDSIELSDSRFNSKYNSQMYNLNYRMTGDKGEELSIDADYGRVYAKSWQDMQSRYMDPDGNEQRLPAKFQYGGPRNIDILSLKADYTKSLSEKSNMEVGVKTGQTVTDNEIQYENLYDGMWEVDYNQTNRFKYIEQVTAAYATYSRKFGDFSAMAGLRAEYTYTKGESTTMDTTFTRSYLGWFPSAYMQYKINEKQGLNLSYSRKINRPGYRSLNPFRTYIDPYTFGSGNPNLQPEYRNTIALRYNYGGYNINASYSIVNDVFEKEFIQDDETRMTHITQNNIGKRQQLTLSAYAPVKINKWYTLNIFAQSTYNMDDARYNGKPLKKNYFGAYTSIQHAFTILPTLRAIVHMCWMPGSWSGMIAKLESSWFMDAQIEKTFFDKRMSLSLSCNDIFASNVWKGKINYGNIDQHFKENYHMRRTILTARYNFGSQKIRSARNRNVGIEDEMGRTK
jgi:hypothetical protein